MALRTGDTVRPKSKRAKALFKMGVFGCGVGAIAIPRSGPEPSMLVWDFWRSWRLLCLRSSPGLSPSSCRCEIYWRG
jgi:hypothetical protein